MPPPPPASTANGSDLAMPMYCQCLLPYGIDSHRKCKTPKTISSSSSSDDGDNGGSRWGGGTSEGIGGDGSIGGGYVSQVDPSMSWAQGDENYYAAQNIDHGYRPGIWEQQKHLKRLTTFPSDDNYSSG